MTGRTISTHIEVFTTNIERSKDAKHVISLLKSRFPHAFINIDLEDCERVLRFENTVIDQAEILNLVQSTGFSISIMEE